MFLLQGLAGVIYCCHWEKYNKIITDPDAMLPKTTSSSSTGKQHNVLRWVHTHTHTLTHTHTSRNYRKFQSSLLEVRHKQNSLKIITTELLCLIFCLARLPCSSE